MNKATNTKPPTTRVNDHVRATRMRVQKARGSSHQPPATIISSTMDLDYGFPQTPPATPRPQTSDLPPCDGEQQLSLSPTLSSTPTEFVDYGGNGQCIGLIFPSLCQPLGYPASMSGESLWAYPSMAYDDHVATPAGGEDPVSSLQANHNTSGDTPASPHLLGDAYSVTSITSAEILLQRITSELDIGPSVGAISSWLHSLPSSHSEDALLSVREKVVHLFLDIWDPSYNHRFIGEYELFVAPSSLLESDENLPLRLVHTKKGIVVAKLLGEMFRAHIVASHDIADAAELLFEHRWSNGYMIGLNTLLNTAGDEICRYAAQPRILSLAQQLEDFKVEYGILGLSMEYFVGVSL
ncbi:hypothetical protein DFH11DRAFT_702711 [Phellopilus nigrolimitatus]|nr:hypothetical protein DFH11DRAFT_702711 [Phellopilus nigrolimitatus]